jgi:pyruvate formate lyase activating enzyme
MRKMADRTGTVFNIQKFSLNDGLGIRTVIFFKGCPLRCKWCANPESQSRNIQVLRDPEKCLHCGTCVRVCPQKAVVEQGSREPVFSLTGCSGCGICVGQCPGKALSLEGEERTIESVAAECMQDIDFYEESGGGITLSGGEALMQPRFAIELLKTFQSKGVHTAMETTGFASPDQFDEVCRYLDLLLFDIKHWDEQAHIEGTGVSNRLPLRNMKNAIASGMSVLPRLPVIPGYNDALSDAKGFAERLHEAGAEEVQLLPFHQFGENKYRMLGEIYPYAGVPALHEEDLEAFKNVFTENGIRAFF